MEQPFRTITQYGAVADGHTRCTGPIQAAIDAAGRAGGGTVWVPPGTFYTGPITLQSHVTLHLDNGTRLLFSDDPADYPLIETYYEGEAVLAAMPQVFADHAENIAITGQGTLDGNGMVWWALQRSRKLTHPRPRLIGFQHCNQVRIDSVTLLNSPSWTINPVLCDNVTIRGVTVINPPDSPNTDGINPDSCRQVHISDCHIDVGDDCITLKSGNQKRQPRQPCENIVITNCTMVHGHGGVVIGSEMSGGVRNVTISNCVFTGTDRGIRIKTQRRRGGLVENIRVSNIVMEQVLCPLVINMQYWGKTTKADTWAWDETPQAVDDGTPAIRNVSLSQLTARGIRAAAAYLSGLPEMKLSDISLADIDLEMTEQADPARPAMSHLAPPMAGQGLIARHVTGLSLSQVRIRRARGLSFTFEDCDNVMQQGCRPEPAEGPNRSEP